MLGQLPFLGSGKHFIVGDSSTANKDMLKEVFGFDPDGTLRYFADLDSARAECTTDAGDEILIMPGHTETLTTAADIALSVSGVKVTGLGTGESRPKFTFSSTDNAATMTIAGDSVSLKNVILIGNDDGLTNMLVVTGDGYDIDIETRDTSAAIEVATAVRLDTANNGKLKITHRGFTAGNAVVSLVRLDDVDNVDIEIDAHGVVTTAWVEMVDASSTNVKVKGTLFTQGITNMTRNVVDTIGSSTWFAEIADRSAGSIILGSNVTAFADADISSIAADIALIKAYTSGTDSAANVLGANDADNGFDSSSVAANVDGSVLERLEDIVVKVTAVDDILDTEFPVVATAVGAVADAALADTIEGAAAATQSVLTDVKGILQRIGADSVNNTAATTLVAPNQDGSLLERIEAIGASTGEFNVFSPNYLSVTANFSSATWNTQATHEIFTVTGLVKIVILPQVIDTLTDAADGSSIQLGIEGTTNALIASTQCAGAGGNTLSLGEFWIDASPADTVVFGTSFNSLTFIAGGGLDVGYEITGAALTGGGIAFHCWWTPLSSDGSVAAGAGGAL